MSTLEAMHGLRFRPLWLLLGWALVLLIAWLSLTASPPDLPFELKFADKIEHFAAYFVTMGWFAQIDSRPRLDYYGFGLIGMGAGLEFLQGMGGVRFFELADMLANTAGVCAAWLLASTRFSHALQAIERLFLPAAG